MSAPVAVPGRLQCRVPPGVRILRH
jgi:hypothetical protein